MKDNILKNIDFFNVCETIEEWLDNNNNYVIWLHDDVFEGREVLMDALSAPEAAVCTEIYVVVTKKNDEYIVSLNIMYQDKEEKNLGEKEYSLGENDNAYMIEQLSKSGVIARMEQEIKTVNQMNKR